MASITPNRARARQFLGSLVFRQEVVVIEKGRDRYGRLLGEVHLPAGQIANRELVANGFAWHYKRYSNDPVLADLEEQARMKRLGLWGDAKTPLAPWEYRARQRESRGVAPADADR